METINKNNELVNISHGRETPEDLQRELSELLAVHRYQCQTSLAAFVRAAWSIVEPGVKLQWNWHLDTICGYLEAVRSGQTTRLLINIPPGAMKSLLVSVFYPAWVWTSSPDHRLLSVSNEQSLSIRDALKMKWIVQSEWFSGYWPITLKRDQNEKTLFVNNSFGHRQSLGITANITGKRGDTLIIDDPHDAKTAQSDIIRAGVVETFDTKLSTRLNDPANSSIILIMQRLHESDLTGHLSRKEQTDWTKLVIPMRYEGRPTFDAGADIGRPELNDPRRREGELLWPGRFPAETVAALEEDLGEYATAGQHQQRPAPAGGGIIKEHWWRTWPEDSPLPKADHQFLSYDTAFSEADSKTAAYSAMTRWAVFYHEQLQRHCLIVLGMWYGRVGYEELRKKAKEWDISHAPEAHLIEEKATGISLIQDLRRAIPSRVRSYCPGRGEDKISRAHSVSPMFEAGMVYAPHREWATNEQDTGLINYVGSFPTGSPPSADLTDTVTQACIYLRNGWWVEHPDDEREEPQKYEHETAYG